MQAFLMLVNMQLFRVSIF